MKRIPLVVALMIFSLLFTVACKKEKGNKPADIIQLVYAKAGTTSLSITGQTPSIAVQAAFSLKWASAFDASKMKAATAIIDETTQQQITAETIVDESKLLIQITPTEPLDWETAYKLIVTEGTLGKSGETFPGAQFRFITEKGSLLMDNISLNGSALNEQSVPRDITYDHVQFDITFSEALPDNDLSAYFTMIPGNNLNITTSADKKKITVSNAAPLAYYRKHTLIISNQLTAANGFNFAGFRQDFYTGLDSTDKFPLISDEQLLDLVQHQTFGYFWDHAHPVSGLIRDRKGGGDVVASGGSGFGLMALIIGIERGFITRDQGVERFTKIVNFLALAERFHGAWPHWLNGSTGKVIPFSQNDNGADLVETSYLAAGLLSLRQYLNPSVSAENQLIDKINQLLNGIEWSWFTRGGQDVLYWHWSPSAGWAMNMPIKGYNEALITYFMAATSTTFPVDAAVYHNGWAGSSYFINGKSFYGYTLPLGFDYGGPLFFAHYSFLGLNPTNLSDQYADYWEQNTNHSLINWKHSVVNPYNNTGYSAAMWGLTASDDPDGYAVHEPVIGADNGTISPTAALSSMPYTPEHSMNALRFFYYKLGDRIWGEYGFYDAFNPKKDWWADSYLAIDQGPIIIMIENYRTQLCWNLFMSAPETQAAMDKLGFSTGKK